MSTKTQKLSQPQRRGGKRRAPLPAVELYTDERMAEFLLSNAVDAKDYAHAAGLVRKMGLDPSSVRHYKPPGVA